MGCELVSDSPPLGGGESANGLPPQISYTEVFYKYLPFYMSIGMTYDQYWNDDCCLVKYYRDAFELKRERENEMLWLQGMYFYEALCDVSPILQAFAKKGTKAVSYSSSPYPITKKEMERRRKEKERTAHKQMKANLNAFSIKFNAQMFNRKGGAS